MTQDSTLVRGQIPVRGSVCCIEEQILEGDGDTDASTLLISRKGRLRHSSLNSDLEIPFERSLIDHRSQSKDE